MTRKPKNRIQMERQGNVVEVRFTASNEEMACRLFDLIEAAGIAMTKFDLEKEWKQDE